MRLASQERLLAYPLQSSDIGAAQTMAIQFASLNKVLGSGLLVLPNVYNSNTGTEDLVLGYLSRPFDSSQPIQTDSTSVPYFNTVQVRTSRTASHGGVVPNFFSALWGKRGSEVRVSTTAAVLGISGYKAIDSYTNADLLPIVLDKATFNAMLQSEIPGKATTKATDQYTFNLATNTVTAGPDGKSPSRSSIRSSTAIRGTGARSRSASSTTARRPSGRRSATGSLPRSSATYPGGVIQPDPATGDHPVRRQSRDQRGDQGRPDEHHRQAGPHPDLRPGHDAAATGTTSSTRSSPSRRPAS